MAIGTVTGLALGMRPSWFIVAMCMHGIAGAHAMQQASAAELSVAVPGSSVAWSDAASPPTCTRVWTHTLAAPL